VEKEMEIFIEAAEQLQALKATLAAICNLIATNA
jgi:hypothetical protein